MLARGVVWVDETRVLYQGFSSPGRVLGGLYEPGPLLASSGEAVAVAGRGPREAFSGGVPPGRLAPVGQISESRTGGGCEWSPSVQGGYGEFTVVGEQLVDAASCGEELLQEQATMQPVFVRNVRGGEWHVLRWLKGSATPSLAAEGDLIAVGVASSTSRMQVTIFKLPSVRLLARFDAPDGYIGFASRTRIVISRRVVPGSRTATRRTVTPSEALRRIPQSYRAELYSLRGRRLSVLGTFDQPPLVSHMHLLTVEGGEAGSVLTVRGIPGGPPRPLTGFEEPARTLEGLAFRWPAVAVVERMSTPRQQAEVTCTSGDYKPPSPPFLAIFDLARAEPFLPAPPAAHLAPPAAKCPPQVIALKRGS